LRTEIFPVRSASVLSYSLTKYLAVRGYFILATARQNSLVETLVGDKLYGMSIEVRLCPIIPVKIEKWMIFMVK